jgi:hypothetical protein
VLPPQLLDCVHPEQNPGRPWFTQINKLQCCTNEVDRHPTSSFLTAREQPCFAQATEYCMVSSVGSTLRREVSWHGRRFDTSSHVGMLPASGR